MPLHDLEPTLLPAVRRRQVAAVLAKGLLRLRRMNQTRGLSKSKESSKEAENGLDSPGETRLSIEVDREGSGWQGAETCRVLHSVANWREVSAGRAGLRIGIARTPLAC